MLVENIVALSIGIFIMFGGLIFFAGSIIDIIISVSGNKDDEEYLGY